MFEINFIIVIIIHHISSFFITINIPFIVLVYDHGHTIYILSFPNFMQALRTLFQIEGEQIFQKGATTKPFEAT